MVGDSIHQSCPEMQNYKDVYIKRFILSFWLTRCVAGKPELCRGGWHADAQTGADVAVLRQNFFLFWETSVPALEAFN